MGKVCVPSPQTVRKWRLSGQTCFQRTHLEDAVMNEPFGQPPWRRRKAPLMAEEVGKISAGCRAKDFVSQTERGSAHQEDFNILRRVAIEKSFFFVQAIAVISLPTPPRCRLNFLLWRFQFEAVFAGNWENFYFLLKKEFEFPRFFKDLTLRSVWCGEELKFWRRLWLFLDFFAAAEKECKFWF